MRIGARKLSRLAVRAIGILVILFLIVCGGLYFWLRTSLPQVDGTLVLPGLHAKVLIKRNHDGIPRIIASDQHDALFALGFVHAQDRLFQMEILRRFGAGELAAIGGKSLVNRDRYMRTLGLARAAKQQLAHLSASTHRALQAYADGVNAYITHHHGILSPIYQFIPGPHKWQPVDSLIVRNLMALYLCQNYRRELLHARIARKVSPKQLSMLFPSYPKSGLVTLARLYQQLPLRRLTSLMPAGIGWSRASNDWVLNGQHTRTGSPILENDPHLTYTEPSIWYLAQIDYPGYELTGGTIPGEPFLVVGHNGHIGWGFTETGGDVEDLFIEKVDPHDPNRYMTPTGTEPFVVHHEIIHVKGGKDVKITVRSTRHGPVISDLVGSGKGFGDRGRESKMQAGVKAALPKPGYVLALQATFLQGDDKTAQAFLEMNEARDWRSFRHALRDYGAPQMNIVFADRRGKIAFIAPGRIPIRKKGHGWLPHPGWTGAYDWTGYIPFGALPQAVNPPDGRFISANNKIVSKSYPYFITSDWAPPYRADRIAALLDRQPKQTMASTAAITADDKSLMARQMLARMLPLTDLTPKEARAVKLLQAWSAHMSRHKVAPLLFEAWLRAFDRALFAEPLGKAFDAYWRPRSEVVEHVLDDEQTWCRSSDGRSCHTLLRRSLDSALAGLRKRFGGRVGDWRWGEVHRARFWSPALSRLPLIGSMLDPSIPTNGGDDTVNAGVMSFPNNKHPFRDVAGPGLRMILDFADLNHSRFLVAPGMSESPLSSHYSDLLQGWRDFHWIEFGTMNTADVLTLKPS